MRALVSCEAVSEELPLVVDGSRRPNPSMAEHLGSCLRCQAELAGYRHLLRLLKSLRVEPVVAPSPPFGPEDWRALALCLATRSRKSRWLAVGATVAVAALGGGAVLAKATRQARLLAGTALL